MGREAVDEDVEHELEALALAMVLILGARLGDRYGRRLLFIIGAAGFTVCSLGCGISDSTGMLVGFRLAQGAFGALLIPQGLGIMRAVFPRDELPKAFAWFGPVIGGAAVFGPIIGAGLSGGFLAPRYGRRILEIGELVSLAGTALVALEALSGLVSTWDILPGLAIAGLGMGLIVAPLFDIIIAAVQDRELGSASGVLNAVQQLAGAVVAPSWGRSSSTRSARGISTAPLSAPSGWIWP